ncbi:holin [Pseudomonas sp.]|uniref:holin n=1 Tax=Pseudomonas sp. TaxID=306 RepID=UPI00257D6364|nr:holin [Pseudomonas sp.]
MANHAPEGIVEAVGASVANKGMMVGAATGFLGWLSQVNWIGITGVLVAVAGLAVSTYFQAKRDRREAIESAARIQALREQCQR